MYNAIYCRPTKLKRLRRCGAVASAPTSRPMEDDGTRSLNVQAAAVMCVLAGPENSLNGFKGACECTLPAKREGPHTCGLVASGSTSWPILRHSRSLQLKHMTPRGSRTLISSAEHASTFGGALKSARRRRRFCGDGRAHIDQPCSHDNLRSREVVLQVVTVPASRRLSAAVRL